MSELTIEVEQRQERGKNSNRRMRGAGLVPAVVYGGDRDPVVIQVDKKRVIELLKSGTGENTVFLLKLAGTKQKRHCMIKDLQVDPLDGHIIHIDFQRIVMTEKVRVKVPIEIQGTAFGVKNEDGVLDFVTREVEVECLPGDIPAHVDLDVSEVHVGQHVEAKDLRIPSEVELVEEGERVIASVAHSRVAEVVAAEEEVEAEELIEAEQEEPEVIRRGKVEEEETAQEGKDKT